MNVIHDNKKTPKNRGFRYIFEFQIKLSLLFRFFFFLLQKVLSFSYG